MMGSLRTDRNPVIPAQAGTCPIKRPLSRGESDGVSGWSDRLLSHGQVPAFAGMTGPVGVAPLNQVSC
jgi:hypothetical protein